MEIVSKKGVSGVVKVMLDMILVGGATMLISLPMSLKWCFENLQWGRGENYWFLLVFLFFTGVCVLVIVYQHATSLQRIAIMALLVSVAYIIKILLYITFLTIVVAMVFLLVGLAGLVFSELFRQAVEVKEENDLTI